MKFSDLEGDDHEFYNGIKYIVDNNIDDMQLDITFSETLHEFGKTTNFDLKKDGSKILVTDANKLEYLDLLSEMRLTTIIKKQLDKFLQGFYEIIPKNLISIFSEQELELLISGLPTFDLDDLKNNTEYIGGYSAKSNQIIWLFEALESFDNTMRAKFVQFVTGSSRIPVQGFSHLQAMHGIQKFTVQVDSQSPEHLPSAHTCFNQLDLPKYESYEQLRKMLVLAITECQYGFGIA